MTAGEALAQAAKRLVLVSETPRLDAEILLAAALGMGRAQLLARLNDALPETPFWDWVVRREAYEPLAYILGEWEFFSLPILCRAPILVPRPETEHLVEAVLDASAVAASQSARVLDLGTGTGCVALAIARNAPRVRVIAVDRNPVACSLAQENARRLELDRRVDVLCADWDSALAALAGRRFHAICSNPPYVEDGAWEALSPVIRHYEDARALLAGPQGLDALRRILGAASRLLTPGGRLCLEIGAGQAGALEREAAAAGWTFIRWRRDLAGRRRTAELGRED